MPLDTAPLWRAIARLEEGLKAYSADVSQSQMRDGLIQRFEFTYDLATRVLRRGLAQFGENPAEINEMTFPTLVRTGWEQGIVPGGWPAWNEYRKLRNQTSHTYDEKMAIAAVTQIPAFLDEVRAMAQRFDERLDQ